MPVSERERPPIVVATVMLNSCHLVMISELWWLTLQLNFRRESLMYSWRYQKKWRNKCHGDTCTFQVWTPSWVNWWLGQPPPRVRSSLDLMMSKVYSLRTCLGSRRLSRKWHQVQYVLVKLHEFYLTDIWKSIWKSEDRHGCCIWYFQQRRMVKQCTTLPWGEKPIDCL